MDIPERYVRLALHLGRHIDGLIDAYIGPPEWQGEVVTGEPIEARRLLDEAHVLTDDLNAADLEDDRKRWLRGQVTAIATMAARESGDEVAWADEVEGCLGVRPTRTPDDHFREVHQRLDEVLPGNGSLRERYITWDETQAVATEKLVPALERLRSVLRPLTHEIVSLPEESVTYEVVSGQPWLAYNWYEGAYRSRVEINADLPISINVLVDLAAHEAYPGHHTERVLKDERLRRRLDRQEAGVVVLSTPESLISEGIAMNALEEALGTRPFDLVQDVLSDLDMTFDPVQAHEIHQADIAFFSAGTNAAFMLYEDEETEAQVKDYLCEVSLTSPDKAGHLIQFIRDPSARAYVSSYTDGQRQCRAFIDAREGNFVRLLTEQLTTVDLISRG